MKLVVLLLLSGFLAIDGRFTHLRGRNPAKPPGSLIVGGEDAAPGQFPWIGALQYDGFGQFCGGSVISDHWFLTAAHCPEGLSATYMSIRVGSRYHDTGGQEYRLIRYIMHPEYYVASMYDFDVAVCEIQGIIGGPNIRPVPLASVEPLPPQRLFVAGWGALEWQGPGPHILQFVRVPVVDRQVCADGGYYEYIRDNMFCAGEYGRDSCQGDSGGPLTDTNNIQVGIVSWGNGCAWDGWPGVNTNIAYPGVRDFIRNHTGV
ncbi:trypsin delta-like [Lutzomyia longipalpis]|uniref:trypsin delta-like n=1 Tax=Lutzomyia longipalpis TaxID=7200 RepID=UPI002483807E|nr:trypsin delta-like [Lutzomyia longipalpis]